MTTAAELVVTEHWEKQSLCGAATNEELFGPEGERAADREVRETKIISQYCMRCTVATECLQTALDQRQTLGVWGGSMQKDRKAYFNGKIDYDGFLARVAFHMPMTARVGAIVPAPVVAQKPFETVPKPHPVAKKPPTSPEPEIETEPVLMPEPVAKLLRPHTPEQEKKTEQQLLLDRTIRNGFYVPVTELSEEETVVAILGSNDSAWAEQISYIADRLYEKLADRTTDNTTTRGIAFLLKAKIVIETSGRPVRPSQINTLAKIEDCLDQYLKIKQPQAARALRNLAEKANTHTIYDLTQEAMIGLLEGLSNYDLARTEANVFSFAAHRMLGAASDAVRKNDSIIRDRRLENAFITKYRKLVALGKTQEEALQTLGSTPTQLNEALTRLHRAKTSSLDAAIEEFGDGVPLWEDFTDEPQLTRLNELLDKESVERILPKLTDKQRAVIALHFGFDGNLEHTLNETGILLGITESRVCQIKGDALAILRDELTTFRSEY